jgi:hypothetical protein
MRHRVVLLLSLLLIPQIQAWAQSEDAHSTYIVAPPPGSVPTPLPDRIADRTLMRTYDDTFKLLSQKNTCSDFYGGPVVAITVLNQFVTKLRKERMADDVTFSMRGKGTYVLDSPSGASYRLFEDTLVNTDGGFYQMRSVYRQRHMQNLGPFAPATRPARALGFLHELGHLIRSLGGRWLIADDGQDREKSRLNTEIIEKACDTQLRSLR